MAVWPQLLHRSTWPPSDAVRHASIAPITRSADRSRWLALRARKLSPWRRSTSATSSIGRDKTVSYGAGEPFSSSRSSGLLVAAIRCDETFV